METPNWETRRISRLEYNLAMPKTGETFTKRLFDTSVKEWRDWLLDGRHQASRVEEDMDTDEIVLMRL